MLPNEQARPCLRCIKRNIGHLCHDEPRDSDSKKSKSVVGTSTVDDSEFQADNRRNSRDQVAGAGSGSMGPPPTTSFDGGSLNGATGSGQQQQPAKMSFDANALGRGNPMLVQPTPVSGIQAQASTLTNNNLNQCRSLPPPASLSPPVLASFSLGPTRTNPNKDKQTETLNFVPIVSGLPDSWMNQNPFQDMHNFHPNYMFGPPQVSDEFNLLNDFLHSSMLEDGGLGTDDQQLLGNQPDTVPKFLSNYNNTEPASNNLDQAGNDQLLPPSAMQSRSMLPPPLTHNNKNNNNNTNNHTQQPVDAEQARDIPRPSSAVPIDKTRAYWLQAADPAGNDTPDQRMQKLLKAKYEAGLLKPFNYVKGYARLSKYLEGHVAPASRQKIIRQLDRFRPLFREKMHALNDWDLILVEMWFEETLMGYDRVFASMAVPACCWRRTGEIFRGNKEMAELINVPVESLRDVRLPLPVDRLVPGDDADDDYRER